MLSVSPTPTGQLDAQKIEEIDLTTEPLQPMIFPSREGSQLSMDQRSLRKVVYGHSKELGLPEELINLVECPIQMDPNKFQRLECCEITDENIRKAAVKIFEFTTFNNPRIITFEKYPSISSYQKARYYLDILTGNAVFFRVGGKQDGKLWSLENFTRPEILDLVTDPTVKHLTDLSDYNFDF